MKKIGRSYEYKGTRYPYVVNLQEAFIELEKKSSKLHALLHTDQGCQRYSELPDSQLLLAIR